MTPTPQQIIELARESTAPEWFDDGVPGWHMGLDLKKFATLLLERYGQPAAGAQEPLTKTKKKEMLTLAGYGDAPLQEQVAFRAGIHCAEQEHGITGSKT